MAVKKNQSKKKKKAKDYSQEVIETFFVYANSYKVTKNPLFLWDIYRFCRKENLDMPEWIFEYFDHCAGNLLIDKPREKIDSLCRKALRLESHGPVTPWKGVKNALQDLNTIIGYQREVKGNSNSSYLDRLGDLAEQFAVHERTVTRKVSFLKKFAKEAPHTINEMRKIFT